MRVRKFDLPNDRVAGAALGAAAVLARPVCARLVERLARDHAEQFKRLGAYANKTYLIDPVDLPWVLRLSPAPGEPRLEPFARRRAPPCDAVISGRLVKLLALVSGRADGDALFFSRDLTVSGDTEAVLALRNTIDDMDMDLIEEIERMAGPLGRPMRFARRRLEGATRRAAGLRDALLAPAYDRAKRIERDLEEVKRAAGLRARPSR